MLKGFEPAALPIAASRWPAPESPTSPLSTSGDFLGRFASRFLGNYFGGGGTEGFVSVSAFSNSASFCFHAAAWLVRPVAS